MGKKVDIAEIEHFSDELKEATSNLHTQLKEVKSNIETVNGMNSFSGKAADAAKTYFTDVHLTLLESFGNLYEDLQTNVDQHMKTFRFNVDGNENAIIRSNYLKEIKKEMQKVYEKLTDEDENIYDTIQEVTDISSATAPSFTDVKEWKDNSIDKINEVNEDLTSFTSTGDEADVDEIMHQIEVVMESVQTNKGQSRFEKFVGASSMRELQKLHAYNVLRRPSGEAIVKELKEKMLNGETLNEEEREILYQYIQSELTAEDIEMINNTKDYLLNDNKKLEKYINESVLSTESSLESEIILLEKYLFAGNLSPSELNENTEERVALRSYLDALKNYHATINEVKNQIGWDIKKDDPLLARVEYLEFDFDGTNQFSAHGYLKTLISVDYHQDMRHYKNRQEYLDIEPINENVMPLAYGNISEIKYYYGQDAVTNRMQEEEDKLKDDMSTMTGEYIGSELLGLGIGMARDAVSIPAGLLLSRAENLYEKSEMEKDLKWFEIKKPANKFNLEMKINDRASLEVSNVRHAELYPTDKTYDMLDRWKLIHEKEPNFPYDEAAINNHDWNELYKLFHEATDTDEMITLSEHDLELYHYMLDGTVPRGDEKNEIIEEIEKMNADN